MQQLIRRSIFKNFIHEARNLQAIQLFLRLQKLIVICSNNDRSTIAIFIQDECN